MEIKTLRRLINWGITISLVLIIGSLFFNATPLGRTLWNNWFHAVQRADDRTAYETLRMVEDTARSMIATYNADVLMWQQFKGSDDREERNWANGARMRANRTATSYNDFMLRNSYVWRDAIPNDIFMRLPIVE